MSKRLKGKSYREAANAAESKRERPEEKKIAKPTPGLVMEVIITSKPSSPNSDAVSSATREVDSDESVSFRPKARRTAKRVLVISDDEDDSVVETNVEDDEATSSKSSKALKKKTVPKKRRLVKRGSPSCDYQGSSAEEDSDVEMASNISDDEDMDIPKNKKSSGKAKALPKPKAKKAASGSKTSSSKSEESDATGADDMDMDLDGPATKETKKPTKRKAGNDNERPAKKAKRADTDPWKLSSRPVQREWTEMQAPPFEIFHFSRKVVDEYTYLDGKIHSLVTSLTAERQWVLSGTPPIHDFGALKTIAAFLDAHLGVDDDGEGTSAEVKKRRREQTGEQMNGAVAEPFSLLILFFLQRSNVSIRSVRFIVYNGTHIVIPSAKCSWISLYARCVLTLTSLDLILF